MSQLRLFPKVPCYLDLVKMVLLRKVSLMSCPKGPRKLLD
jgi:hypothetical protein